MQLSVLRLAHSQLPIVNKPSSAWRVGQLVQGTVLHRLSASRVMLSIAGHELVASVPLRLAEGQQLLLRVSSLEPQPLLHLVSNPLKVLPEPRHSAPVAMGYRSSALQQLLNTLMWLSNEQKPLVSGLPKSVRALIAGLLSGVRSADTLIVPDSLQRAIWDSGLLLEARLASISDGLSTTSAIDLDFKARLLQLRNVLDQHLQRSPLVLKLLSVDGTPLQRLLATVGKVVQRIEERQLSSLASAAKKAFAWQVEIPFWGADCVRIVELVLERHDSHADPALAAWTASIALDVGALGIVLAQVTLTGQSIAVQLWATHSSALAWLSRRKDRLADSFSRLGLCVTSIRCEPGMPATRPRAGHSLIQLQA